MAAEPATSTVSPSSHQRFVELVTADKTPWYRKKNLTRLYMFLAPAAMGVEWTSGFDGSIMNGLQAVENWDNCSLFYHSSGLSICWTGTEANIKVKISGDLAAPC
jgi:hypothetical protein